MDIEDFLSRQYGEDMICVTATSTSTRGGRGGGNKEIKEKHMHQFGNTRSGVKATGDTRTVHIVNAATVRQLSKKIGKKLSPLRFRQNIVVDGLEPWKEFDFVGTSLIVNSSSSANDNELLLKEKDGRMKLDVISRAVRCAGIRRCSSRSGDRCIGYASIVDRTLPRAWAIFCCVCGCC